ncbi:MAG: hypothetical protein AAGB51_06855 [Planctomycetota bacterium]
MIRTLLWSIWAVLPVLGLSYHFGPGQTHLSRDYAASLLAEARRAEAEAERLHQAAFDAHLAVFESQRRAFVDTSIAAEDIPDAAREAVQAERDAYERASDAWASAAALYGEVASLLRVDGVPATGELGRRGAVTDDFDAISLAEARAMVRSGEVFRGISRLESILEERMASGDSDERGSILTASVREELAASKYVGARLLREEGFPGEVWREVATEARQHYALLAQREFQVGQSPEAERLRLNVERVLDLEQSDRSELDGMPLPRRSPRGRRAGDRDPGDGPPENQPSQQPRRGPPANGASGRMPFGPGW